MSRSSSSRSPHLGGSSIHSSASLVFDRNFPRYLDEGYDAEEEENMLNVLNSQPDPLHSVCLFGDDYIEITREFLKTTSDIHAKNGDGNSAIISACTSGVKTSELLLEKGANFNDQDSHNNSVLHLICDNLSTYKNIEGYRNLISRFSAKINFNVRNDNEATALHLLCCNNSKVISVKIEIASFAEELLNFGIDPNIEDSLGNIAIHSACAYGNEKVVEKLIPLTTDIDARNHEGDSALHLACQKGHIEIAQMLLQEYLRHRKTNDEYPPFRNELGQTPLDLAHIAGHKNLIDITKNNFEILGIDTPHSTTETDQKTLIFEKNPTQLSPDELTQHVMSSIKIISRKDLEADIQNCAKIESESERNNALISSFGKMCLNLERELESFGDDFDVAEPKLYFFFTQEREAFVKKMLENLDANIADDSQTTTLDLLCKYGYVAATEFAIGRGENLEHRNNKGQTALHLACEYGHGKVANLLIESGCNKNTVNTLNQETPFDTALNNMHYDVATMLLENVSNSTTQLLAEEIPEVDDRSKMEINYLTDITNQEVPSPYPQPSRRANKFITTSHISGHIPLF